MAPAGLKPSVLSPSFEIVLGSIRMKPAGTRKTALRGVGRPFERRDQRILLVVARNEPPN
jgi:hypothetical protein